MALCYDPEIHSMPEFDVVYLSPHLDDAVFSCAGRIHQECRSGRSVLIVTVTAGDPDGPLSKLACDIQRKAGLESDALERRRAEDRQAAGELGAELLHWPLVDAVYRRDPVAGAALYPSRRRLFGSAHPSDGPFESELAALVGSLPPHRELLLPLALGGHVDHRLVRKVGEERAAAPCGYWEDFPYASRLLTRLRELPPSGRAWHSETVALAETALEARCRAMECYASQVQLIFSGVRRMRRRVHRTVRRLGGERYWRRESATRL